GEVVLIKHQENHVGLEFQPFRRKIQIFLHRSVATYTCVKNLEARVRPFELSCKKVRFVYLNPFRKRITERDNSKRLWGMFAGAERTSMPVGILDDPHLFAELVDKRSANIRRVPPAQQRIENHHLGIYQTGVGTKTNLEQQKGCENGRQSENHICSSSCPLLFFLFELLPFCDFRCFHRYVTLD